MTEFDIQWPDVVERADALEDAMRIYFSHSGVSAFTLWGFWNKYMRLPADMELVYGNDLQVRLPTARWGVCVCVCVFVCVCACVSMCVCVCVCVCVRA